MIGVGGMGWRLGGRERERESGKRVAIEREGGKK